MYSTFILCWRDLLKYSTVEQMNCNLIMLVIKLVINFELLSHIHCLASISNVWTGTSHGHTYYKRLTVQRQSIVDNVNGLFYMGEVQTGNFLTGTKSIERLWANFIIFFHFSIEFLIL